MALPAIALGVSLGAAGVASASPARHVAATRTVTAAGGSTTIRGTVASLNQSQGTFVVVSRGSGAVTVALTATTQMSILGFATPFPGQLLVIPGDIVTVDATSVTAGTYPTTPGAPAPDNFTGILGSIASGSDSGGSGFATIPSAPGPGHETTAGSGSGSATIPGGGATSGATTLQALSVDVNPAGSTS